MSAINADGAVGAGNEKEMESFMFSMDPFVANIGNYKQSRFLKMIISVELSKPALADKTKAKAAPIREIILFILTTKDYQTLVSAEGKMQLKDEIKIQMNLILGEGSVKEVYLTDFIMQ
jgi:flagellar FliL protein